MTIEALKATDVNYECRSRGGRVVSIYDSAERAIQHRDDYERRGVTLSVVKVTRIEEEIN